GLARDGVEYAEGHACRERHRLQRPCRAVPMLRDAVAAARREPDREAVRRRGARDAAQRPAWRTERADRALRLPRRARERRRRSRDRERSRDERDHGQRTEHPMLHSPPSGHSSRLAFRLAACSARYAYRSARALGPLSTLYPTASHSGPVTHDTPESVVCGP